ncbi:Arm DNA-binding domain-containing protein [Chryseobacterium sp. JJR-5R]|uniref:Arm DNA-binding domain-containing protein n=1 Tax=Chryseobacterium sp. JJR-5R TaxID=3093923 RepID=UPI002A763EA0|nr:Arm DNA-binding domain-containing protein [Chryseobacterium sp. JJR-5R]WPO83728.1 Arm DNA-binding domain-containing protein [Chryseobacterium sp. JJR-5R]
MNKTFNLLFYVKKSKINLEGEAPVYLRITIDGKVCEISTKLSIQISKWISKAQKVSGSTEAAKPFNFYLKTFEQKVYDTYNVLLRNEGVVTSQILKNKILGTVERARTLIHIFRDHNDRMEKLVGFEFAKG